MLVLVLLVMSCGLLPTWPGCEHPRVRVRQGRLLVWRWSGALGTMAALRYLVSSGRSLELVMKSLIIESVSLSSLVDGLEQKTTCPWSWTCLKVCSLVSFSVPLGVEP